LFRELPQYWIWQRPGHKKAVNVAGLLNWSAASDEFPLSDDI
jgi:hypothetical protein